MALFLIIACSVQTFYGNFIIVDYYANTNAYAANCINKNKPQLHCNGKCQMQKKMNEADNKDKQQPTRKNAPGTNTLSSKTSFAFITCTLNTATKQQFFVANEGMPIDMAAPFFHPPCIHV